MTYHDAFKSIMSELGYTEDQLPHYDAETPIAKLTDRTYQEVAVHRVSEFDRHLGYLKSDMEAQNSIDATTAYLIALDRAHGTGATERILNLEQRIQEAQQQVWGNTGNSIKTYYRQD